MPLSEHEQKLLEQMERALYAEDPRFASHMKGSAHSPNRRRVIVGVCVALAGLAIVVAGVATELIALGVVGFVVMVAGVAWAATPPRKHNGPELTVVHNGDPKTTSGPSRPGGLSGRSGKAKPKPKPKGGGSFTQRMEERWDKRRNDGGF